MLAQQLALQQQQQQQYPVSPFTSAPKQQPALLPLLEGVQHTSKAAAGEVVDLLRAAVGEPGAKHGSNPDLPLHADPSTYDR
jgi:hypothetical protein